MDDIRLLIDLAVCTAQGDEPALLRSLRRASRSGVPPRRIRETLLQQTPFAGIGRVINAFVLWIRLDPRSAQTLHQSAEATLSLPRTVRGGGSGGRGGEADGTLRRRGEAVCRRVYGAEYRALRAWMRRLDPGLDAWMIDAGYGRVMARPGLDLRTRELLAVAVLASMRLWPQLRAHLRGARRVGASAAEIRRALTAARRRLTGKDRRKLDAEII